jgi:MoaA/NifB/PqqE/SkfB family radical SAM enzyme
MAYIIIDDIKDFSLTPKLSVDNFDGVDCELFGKPVQFRDDYWLRNIHVKITDRCNAMCEFCIEKDSHVEENAMRLLTNLESLMRQMNKQGLLSTITITGGEPTLCGHLQNVLNLIAKYDVFSSMNTNGSFEGTLHNAPDWINVSKHGIDDADVFKWLYPVSLDDLQGLKDRTGSKLRLQGLLQKGYLDSVDKVLKYMTYYDGVADDFGFRQLIGDGDNIKPEVDLIPLRKFLFKNAQFVEQVIQDYYVYETWKYNGKQVTLSFSDMGMLIENEKTEDPRILREIIVHPDGMITGDWNRKTKVITQ